MGVLGIVAVLGIAQAVGVVTMPTRAPWDSEERVAARTALELDPGAVVADGIAAEPVDLLGNPVQEEPVAAGEGIEGDAVTGAPADEPVGDESEDDDAPSGGAEGTDAAPTVEKQVDAIGRLRIDAVGMDVPLAAIDRGDDVTPPGYRAGYVLRDGPDGAAGVAGVERELEGTVVIAMHSMRTGFAPGNYLVSDDGSALVPDGAEIEALDRTWRVTGSEQIPKDELPSRSDIWEERPGRLVLITCRQTGDEYTTANTVVIAQEVEE